MTTPSTVDLLDLAEAVAEGRLRREDAELQLRTLHGLDHGAAADREIRELRRLITAAEAVRGYMAAIRHASTADVTASNLGLGSVPVVAPNRSTGVRVVRPHTIRRGTARAPRRTWLLVAATLLVGAGVVGATLTGATPPTPSPRSSLPSTIAQTSASPAAASEAATRAGFVLPPGISVDASRIRLVSDSVGWLATATALYRTTDMGITWTQLHPPAGSETGSSGSGGTSFVDADTAYVLRRGSPLTVSATHDGGATWTGAVIAVPVGSIGPLMTFRSPMMAYATFQESPESAWDRLLIYATTDGGVTWTGPTRGTAPSLAPGANKIEGAWGDALWLSDGKADNAPFDEQLAITFDGGVTWTQGSFPIDKVAVRGDLKWPLAVLGVDGGHIVLAIVVGDEKTDPQVIYDSADNGRSWQFIRSWPQPYLCDIEVQFLSPTTWVLVAPDGSEVWSTVDAGAHWRRAAGNARLWLPTTTFGSPDHGWAIHVCMSFGHKPIPGPDPACDGTGATAVLMATTDGGRTWTPFGDRP
jgi:photosystem II stability/assembly factor-like uncharacterized protein